MEADQVALNDGSGRAGARLARRVDEDAVVPPFTSTSASAPAPPMVLLSPVTSISVPDDSSWAESAPTPHQSPAIVLPFDSTWIALPGKHSHENPPNASPRTVDPPEPPARSSARPTAALGRGASVTPGVFAGVPVSVVPSMLTGVVMGGSAVRSEMVCCGHPPEMANLIVALAPA